jgi:hypothetical protein
LFDYEAVGDSRGTGRLAVVSYSWLSSFVQKQRLAPSLTTAGDALDYSSYGTLLGATLPVPAQRSGYAAPPIRSDILTATRSGHGESPKLRANATGPLRKPIATATNELLLRGSLQHPRSGNSSGTVGRNSFCRLAAPGRLVAEHRPTVHQALPHPGDKRASVGRQFLFVGIIVRWFALWEA